MDEIDAERVYDAFDIPKELRPQLDKLRAEARRSYAHRREEEEAFLRRRG